MLFACAASGHNDVGLRVRVPLLFQSSTLFQSNLVKKDLLGCRVFSSPYLRVIITLYPKISIFWTHFSSFWTHFSSFWTHFSSFGHLFQVFGHSFQVLTVIFSTYVILLQLLNHDGKYQQNSRVKFYQNSRVKYPLQYCIRELRTWYNILCTT